MKKWYYFVLMIAVFIHPISMGIESNEHENSKHELNGPHTSGESLSDLSNESLNLDFNLPGDLQPEKYDLEFFTDVGIPASTYSGKVLITVKCLKSTNEIILHQKNLRIHKDDVEIKLSGSEPPSLIPVKKQEYNSVHEQYIIILWQTLEKNKNYEIKIEYSGPKINPLSRGYLFDTYTLTRKPVIDQQNSITQYTEYRKIAFTMMSDMGARRVFPCFDQTGMKATFKIKHSHSRTMKGLSNADTISTKPVSYPPLFNADVFTETVPMDVNSVALVLFAFSSKKLTSTTSNTKIRIFADELIFEGLQSIVGIAAKIFQFFSNYYRVPYPFTKLDIIAIPPIWSEAVAFYGIIYISENRVLNGLKQTSNSAYYEIVSEMCHAISQQWIGHTVTVSKLIDNWIHIALNIFLQTQCVLQMEPKWEQKFIEPDVINSYLSLFPSELRSTLPYQSFLVMGNSPNYLDDVFNRKLKKAYHLIRMIHFFLGPEIFHKSINDYVEKFKFSNADFEDLWDVFTNTANTVQPRLLLNISVKEIMTSWVPQKSYPLITVTWKRETKQISISQVPFNKFKTETPIQNEDSCWLIPLSYTTKTESKFQIDNSVREWLTCNDLHLHIDMNEDDWFLLDLKVNVIGRVNYDEAIWVAIQKSLVNNEEPDVFHAFIRARLISDMFFFAEIGNLSYAIVLDTMKYLPREDQYENWAMALREFDKIRSRLLRSSVYHSFEKYVQGLLNSIFEREDYQNFTQLAEEDSDLKIAITESACKYDVLACHQKSLELIGKWKRGEETLDSVPVALQETILCQGVKYGNRRHWNFMWNLYEQEKDSSFGNSFLRALACSKSTKILKRLLEWSINEKQCSVGDRLLIFQSLSSNRKAYKLLRTFFMNNFNRITQLYPTSAYIYWEELFNTTATKKDLDQLLEFAKSQGLTESINSPLVQESLNRAKKNITWLQKNEKTLENYFQNSTPRRRWILF